MDAPIGLIDDGFELMNRQNAPKKGAEIPTSHHKPSFNLIISLTQTARSLISLFNWLIFKIV